MSEVIIKVKNHSYRLRPFFEVKEELHSFVKQHGLEEPIKQAVIRREDGSLFNALCTWGVALTGKYSCGPAIRQMGLVPKSQLTDDEVKQYILGVITEDFMLDAYKGKLSRQVPIKKLLFEAGKLPAQAYQATFNKSRTNKLSLVDIINDAYPHLTRKFHVQPYDMLRQKPISKEKVIDSLTRLYYDGFDLSQESLSKLSQGNLLVYAARRHASMTSKRMLGFPKAAAKLMEYEKCKPHDLVGDKSSATKGMGTIVERFFFMFLSILKQHDPQLSYFPDLKSVIGSPLQEVYMNAKQEDVVLEGDEPRESDGMVVIDGKNYVVEVKKSDYTHDKALEKSLAKYDQSNMFVNGKRIHGKILYVDKPSRSVVALKKKYSEKGWHVFTGGEFLHWFPKSVDILSYKEKTFHSTSPLNINKNIITTYHLVHQRPHILARRGEAYFRQLTSNILKKNIEHILGHNGDFKLFDDHNMIHSATISDFREYGRPLSEVIPNDILFFDLETSGWLYSGAQIIMAGIGQTHNKSFRSDVYFARHPFEEEEILLKNKELFENARVLVTFNGRSFDVPFLKSRYFAKRIPFKPRWEQHIDLYRDFFYRFAKDKEYPKKSLQEYEWIKFGFSRKNDISGAEIPVAYENYLMGESEDRIEKGILHNHLDVLSMAFAYIDYLHPEKSLLPLFEHTENKSDVPF